MLKYCSCQKYILKSSSARDRANEAQGFCRREIGRVQSQTAVTEFSCTMTSEPAVLPGILNRPHREEKNGMRSLKTKSVLHWAWFVLEATWGLSDLSVELNTPLHLHDCTQHCNTCIHSHMQAKAPSTGCGLHLLYAHSNQASTRSLCSGRRDTLLQ